MLIEFQLCARYYTKISEMHDMSFIIVLHGNSSADPRCCVMGCTVAVTSSFLYCMPGEACSWVCLTLAMLICARIILTTCLCSGIVALLIGECACTLIHRRLYLCTFLTQ